LNEGSTEKMDRKRSALIITFIAAIAVVVALYLARGWVVERVYFKTAEKVADKFSTKAKSKYFDDFHYTTNKFWTFYQNGTVSRNDLNDVIWKMRKLEKKREVSDTEAFDFIGYVSRLYTDAMNEKLQKKINEKMQNERNGQKGKLKKE